MFGKCVLQTTMSHIKPTGDQSSQNISGLEGNLTPLSPTILNSFDNILASFLACTSLLMENYLPWQSTLFGWLYA